MGSGDIGGLSFDNAEFVVRIAADAKDTAFPPSLNPRGVFKLTGYITINGLGTSGGFGDFRGGVMLVGVAIPEPSA